MHDRTFRSKLILVSAASLAVLLFVVLGFTTAVPTFAQSPTPTPRGIDIGADARAREFKAEQTWSNIQQEQLNRATQLATDVQNFINEQNTNGKNTTTLVTALATFNTQLTNAKKFHTTAANLISAHAGFDANGNVTNTPQAGQTIDSVRQPLLDAHRTLRQALRDLEQVVHAFRLANPTS